VIRAGVIRNLKSHRNQAGTRPATPPGVLEALPDEPDDLDEALDWFAESGVDLVVIDGGDGTIRDVLSRVSRAYGEDLPRFAIIPNGKTNALALDLGMRLGTLVEQVLAMATNGGQTKLRSCLEVVRAGQNEPELRGFLLGLGAFVRATEHAQKVHGRGFFDKAAIGVTLAGAIARTLMGGPQDPWRSGEAASVGFGEGDTQHRDWFLVLAATLKRFPLGLRPFGPPHDGLKVLTVEAPPRRLWPAIPAILRGSQADWLGEAGYRRTDTPSMTFSSKGTFVLDGEIFPAGEVTVRQGPDIRFVMA
jgi:diacylglycerol kinase family enzyme